jgi:nicotinate-nucleotide adenylyltransferase
VRLLLFGGTFNPVHWGHLVLAEELLAEFAYDLVLFVPSGRPPHKELAEDPGPEIRLEMLRLATLDNPAFAVDDCELRRAGPSYTIDTLRGLSSRWNFDGKPGLVLGDDLVPGYPSWREPDAVARESDIVVARRTGELHPFPYPHREAANRLVPLSSSEIRALAKAGQSLRYLVPEPVRELILSRGLYGAR